jgi:hypothetical protein
MDLSTEPTTIVDLFGLEFFSWLRLFCVWPFFALNYLSWKDVLNFVEFEFDKLDVYATND